MRSEVSSTTSNDDITQDQMVKGMPYCKSRRGEGALSPLSPRALSTRGLRDIKCRAGAPYSCRRNTPTHSNCGV